MKNRVRHILPVIVLLAVSAWAKEKNETAFIMFWPDAASPTLKLDFGKFIQTAEYAGQKTYICEVVVQNVSQRRIPSASLTVRMLDKDKVRIADSVLNVTDLGPGESSKIPLQIYASGMPASLSLVATVTPPEFPPRSKQFLSR